MTLRLALPLMTLCAAPIPALAQDGEGAQALFDAMRLGDIIAVMQDEGVEYGADLEDEMFPGQGGAAWRRVVEGIYDTERMESQLVSGLDRGLSDADTARLVTFFTSDLGRTITDLEVAARQALRDETVEDAAEERAARMRAEEAPRIAMIETLIEANDLLEMNVAGALNSNFAFYRGLDDGDAFPEAMGESQMIADVWAQEPEIRGDTEQWLYGFLTLAYEPLSDADLDAYISLSETDTGQALNSALFGAFDRVFVDISTDLGRAAAQFMQAQDI